MTNQPAKMKKRLLQGTKTKCVDGRWSADDLPLPDALIVTGFARGLQCWKGGELLDELDERDGPLPDLDELNDQIPREEWEAGLDGKPRPPWAIVYCVYLVDPETAEVYTFINSTFGARIAHERLVDRIEMMTRLRGAGVTALVRPDCRQMKTKFGTKLRPEFTILDWRDLGPSLPAAQSPAQLPSPDKNHAADTTEKKKKAEIGKPVESVTIEEELNDRIPDQFV